MNLSVMNKYYMILICDKRYKAKEQEAMKGINEAN